MNAFFFNYMPQTEEFDKSYYFLSVSGLKKRVYVSQFRQII
jgi:hypothetical protein